MSAAPVRPRPTILCILDGWGWREDPADNAPRQARTPNFDRFWAAGPRNFLRASEEAVGLPPGQIGNSEVGHLNLGSGRVVRQELGRIDHDIAAGALAHNPALQGLIAALRGSGGTCHLLGLVSPGGVHAHQDHVRALAAEVARHGVPVVLHAITDGRDVPPRQAAETLPPFAASLPAGVRVASVCGRYWAMDRDQRWERVARAYALIVRGEAPWVEGDAAAALAAAHGRGEGDEFVAPTRVGAPRPMRDGDGLLCANFRADRVRQILASLLEPDFSGFDRGGPPPRFAAAVGMAPYSERLDAVMGVIFRPEEPRDVLGEIVARAGRTQLRIAETEKYPHVTFFLNGGREEPYPGEDRILVPSPKVATYDLQPEMSAPEVTDRVVAAVESGRYDLVVINYANPDMVGHTGVLAAAVRACEAVDAGLGRLAEAVLRQGGTLLVTADHGNCELMRDPATGGPHTAHTLNEVPLFLIGAPPGVTELRGGVLADVAPTLLDLMGLAQPAAMTGRSLLVRG